MAEKQPAFGGINLLKYAGYATCALMAFFVGADIYAREKKRRERHALKEATVENKSPEKAPSELPKTRISPISPRIHGHSEVPIIKVCITGGPCAGKTSALAFLTEKLSERGYKVFCVPEVPTLTVHGGGMIVMGLLTQDRIIRFQTLLMRAQLNLEDYFIELAALNGKPAIVFFDRGVMDPAAYMSPEVFQALLDEQGWNQINLRDKRYDMVLHLVTAADGAEEYYTLANNAARYESEIDVAIATDRRTQNAWIGHPNFVIIDNTTERGFDRKLARTFEAIGMFLGFPTPTRYFRKFVLQSDEIGGVPIIPKELKCERFSVEEMFMKPDKFGATSSIRKRGQNGSYTYSQMTRFPPNEKGERVEKKRTLSAREYLGLMEQRDESISILHKERFTFVWERQSYIIDWFFESPEKLLLLRVETDKNDKALRIPSFLRVEKEVTDDDYYSSFAVIKRITASKATKQPTPRKGEKNHYI